MCFQRTLERTGFRASRVPLLVAAGLLALQCLGCGAGIVVYEFPVVVVELKIRDAVTLEPPEDLQVELRLVAGGDQDRTLESFVCEGDTLTSCMMGNWEGQPLVELLFPFVTRRDLQLSEVVVRVWHDGCEQTHTIDINESTVADPAPNAYTLRLADTVLVDPCG